MEIHHAIPQIGFCHISLFPPADSLFRILEKRKEIRRLSRLRHLGVLAHVLHGARHARIDYTAALLYFSNAIKSPGFNSSFAIGGFQFSSQIAALQCASLIWNIGHLPGTFAVEKGLYSHLYNRSPESPAHLLPWPNADVGDIKEIIAQANSYLLASDFLGISRVLAVLKLLLLAEDDDKEFLTTFAKEFAAPFLLDYDTQKTSQWGKLRTAYSLIRHLAYLTMDAHLSGLQWAPSIPALLEQQMRAHRSSVRTLADNISEILSPVERMTYDSIYHNPEARKEVAAIANWIHRELNETRDQKQRVATWLEEGMLQRLHAGRRPKRSELHRIAAVRVRSLLSPVSDTPSQIEEALSDHFSHPVVFHYRAWNSNVLLEPDELVIDVLNSAPARTSDVGRIMIWLIRRFEKFWGSGDIDIMMLHKTELDEAYAQLAARAVTLAYGDYEVEFYPWDLADLGVLEEAGPEARNGIWASNARLDEPFVRHLTRRRRAEVPERLKAQKLELHGLTRLREWVRQRDRRTRHLRQRWLVATSSVVFVRGGARQMEFDGGMMKVSSRSGRLTWYGLETKGGPGNPDTSLRRRLRNLGLVAEIHRLDASHAVAVIELPN